MTFVVSTLGCAMEQKAPPSKYPMVRSAVVMTGNMPGIFLPIFLAQPYYILRYSPLSLGIGIINDYKPISQVKILIVSRLYDCK